MRTYILSLPEKMQFLIIVLGTIFIAFLSAAIINKAFGHMELISKLELITSIYAVLGTVYAVLIAFSVSGVWQNYCACELAISAEIAALVDLVHLVRASHSQDAEPLRKLALEYTQKVVTIEWPILATGHNDAILSPDSETLGLAMRIMAFVQHGDPKSPRDTAVFSHSLSLLTKWLDARRTRLMIAKGNTAKSLWPLLIAGAFILFGFHGLFITKNPELWATLLFFFSGIIGLSFYLIFTLDSPYSGTATTVDANAFKWAHTWLTHEPRIHEATKV